MASGGKNAKGTSPSSMFDFEEFKKHATSPQVLQTVKKDVWEKYKSIINDLENSIKKRDKTMFVSKLGELERFTQFQKVKKIEPNLKDLRDKWKKGDTRGGNSFQNICVKKDILTPSVSPAPTTSEKKGSPPSGTGATVDIKILREIANILDDENQEKGAKQKRPPDVNDLLTKIKEACQEVAVLRMKPKLEEINKTASFKPLVIWATEFGKCVEKKTFMEDGIDPSTTNANDKELKAILEQLNRSMKLLYAQKLDQDSLEKTLKNKANELMLILKTQQPTVKDKKKPSGSKDRNIESMDTEKVMDICISELQIRIDHLSNQATRLTQASATLTNTNKKLVAQIEQNKLKQTKKATNNEQNEIIQDLETVTKNIETKLGDLETNCKRYEEVVKEVDEEIEKLERDLEEWDQHQNIVDLKQKYEKCCFDALRNSRIKLQKCKTESKETKKQDKNKKIGEKVKQLCERNGIENDDDFVRMLDNLEKQLHQEKQLLNALEKETFDLLKHFDGQNEFPDKISDMSTVDKLSSLIKSANANVVKLKEDCRKDTETAKIEANKLQTAYLQLTQEVYKLVDEKPPKEISLPIDTMSEETLTHIRKAQSDHDDLENRLNELQSTFLQVLEDIYGLAGTTAPTEVTDPVAMRDNAKQQLQDLKRTHKKLKSEFGKLNEEISPFVDELLKGLDTATKTLTGEETEPVSRQGKNSNDLKMCLIATEKIKTVANEFLASLDAAFDNIIGEGCLYHGNNFDKSKSKPWGHVQGRIQIIFEMAVDNGITGLRRNLDDLREKAETEKREKEDQMARFQSEIIHWKEMADKERLEKEDYMTRFSKIASAQLTDNNPNIADLSDQNRPTKLADEYSEIYDNEWTDAYTYLEEETKSEPETIEKLLKILLDVYDVCCKIRDQQLMGMKTAILRPAKFYHSQNQVQQVAERPESVEKPNAQQGDKGKSSVSAKSKEKKSHGGKVDDMKLDPVLSKTLTDIGKETSATTIDDVLKYFKTQQKQLFEAEPMDRYSTKLICLCWLMRLHSPPVCIGSIEEKGSKFDKTKYRAYTKSGKKIEFVVWPTLLLHENGGILKQGTAQGFK